MMLGSKGQFAKTTCKMQRVISFISHALDQLDESAKKLSGGLTGYTLYFRIVANRINTQAIRDTKYHRYQKKWQGRLQKKTTCMEEDI